MLEKNSPHGGAIPGDCQKRNGTAHSTISRLLHVRNNWLGAKTNRATKTKFEGNDCHSLNTGLLGKYK